jgi:uncharacterized protein with HEPN domain
MYEAYDVELTREILRQIHRSTLTILKRFEPIASPDDFTASDEGMEKLDSICMQLIAIGEGVKNLDRVTDGALFQRYPEIKWERVMGMRDVLSHHYFDVDVEIVYSVCADHMGELANTIQRIIYELQ